MSQYRIYPLDGSGRVRRPLDAECGDDTAAIAFAQDLGGRVKDGCEIWSATRFVGRFHFRGAAPRPQAESRPESAVT